MYIEQEFTGHSSWASENFTGSAHFFLAAEDYDRFVEADPPLLASTRNIITADRIGIDLVIDSISFQSADVDQLEPHIGDSFSHHFYGYSPIILNAGAQLVDTTHSIGKAEFMDLYRWLFRIKRVARTGVVPALSFIGCTAQGAMLSVQINESSDNEDIIGVRFSFLVLSMRYKNLENIGINSIDIDFSSPADMWSARKPPEEDREQVAEASDPDIEIYNEPTVA